MSRALLEKMISEETKDLSVELLNEILDFIQFIKAQRQKKRAVKPYEKSLSNQLSALNQISLLHLEDEFTNYREKFPYEQ